jgi:hypothetical protein
VYAQTRAYLVRQRLEEGLRAELRALGRPMVELPLLPGGVGRDDLSGLADALADGR